MRTFVRGERCRKTVLEEFMDGNPRAARCRAGEGEARCDVCERERDESERGSRGESWARADMGAERTSLESEGRKRKLGMIEAEEKRLGKRARGETGDRWESTERLRRKLQRYAEGCAICVTKGFYGDGDGKRHEWWDCEAASDNAEDGASVGGAEVDRMGRVLELQGM